MDQDFIAELDAALSNVGSDQVWKKTVGGVELWISPLQLSGQEKVAEIITKTDLGANIISESKRMTLAHAIVGFDRFDLREYRAGAPVFPVSGKDGKPAKTTLDKYLYQKLGTWGAQFIDDAFAVYADLMESFQKANLKDIKFENAKDPREELAELQARVFELRQQLRLPMLVESKDEADQELSDQEGLEFPPEPAQDAPSPIPEDFDPFQKAPPRAAAPPPQAAPVIPVPRAVPDGPVDPDGAAARRAAEAAEIENSAFHASGAPAVQAQPVSQPLPARMDVVDRPASRAPVAPPVIDRVPAARNPRFNPPQR